MQPDMTPQEKEKHPLLWPVLTILLIALVLQLIYTRRQTGFQELKPQSGVLNISGLDLEDRIFTIANDWDFYPRKLYTHKDFQNGVEAPQEIPTGSIPYGTHRLVIQGSPGQYLSLCGYSVDYGSRIYVDGQPVFSSGVVSDSPETSVPKTGYLTVPVCLGEDG